MNTISFHVLLRTFVAPCSISSGFQHLLLGHMWCWYKKRIRQITRPTSALIQTHTSRGKHATCETNAITAKPKALYARCKLTNMLCGVCSDRQRYFTVFDSPESRSYMSTDTLCA